MDENFADRLVGAIEEKGTAICVGIDPMIEAFPAEIAPGARDANDARACVDAIFAFTTRVLKVVAGHVPVVKFQSAYFEKYLWEGVEAYYSLVQEAKELGLVVIGDVKRGDIGATSTAYAEAHLGAPLAREEEIDSPDAITVNPFCGLDTIEPFVQMAGREGKGLFVLVRTSNPGSGALQDQMLADGRTYSEMLADGLRPITEASAVMGKSGWSSIGAVVGATQIHTMVSLRKRLPHSIFLLPGYGTQGATGEMTRAAFAQGKGALVSASRSIIYAHKDEKYRARFGEDWGRCVEAAVIDMKQDVGRFMRGG